eukprot:GEMP01089458.1.p1 GENE.GEMP01089458.1~~GEMP01089458.1.p1  ORF type:complete len:258 (+),score=50.06 GEMP01089458.1:46-819(+)
MVDMDVELLEAMYPGEVSIDGGIVRLPVAPQVGGNAKAQFISATLVWDTATHQLSFDKCLGLLEDQARRMCEQIDTSNGLLETVQEAITLITELNEQLSADCPICLTALTSGGLFRLRGCFHTMHRKCANDWWQSSGSQLCAVCRRPADKSDMIELTGTVSEDDKSCSETRSVSDKGPKMLLLRTEHNCDFSEDFRDIKEEMTDILVSAGYYSLPVHKAKLRVSTSKVALDWLLANNGRYLASGEKLVVALNFDEGY